MEYSVMEYSVELATIQFDIKFGVNPDIKLGGKLCIDFDIKRVRIAKRSVTETNIKRKTTNVIRYKPDRNPI